VNQTLNELYLRKSTRVFEPRPIPIEAKNQILKAAIEAPTAGNQSLYTILDIEDQNIKEELALSCDDQAFIAKAPMVLIFLADCQKWLDAYAFAKTDFRKPGLGDLILACEDALIAAQNAVVAAESLGIGSCYIGDILENHDKHVELLELEGFVFPVTMLVFGYPTQQQRDRVKPTRFEQRYIVKKDKYSRSSENELRSMFAERQAARGSFDFDAFISAFCKRKYMSDFALELNRSTQKYLEKYLR
jgi:nitroreductase